jgi:hypothetical protein
MSEQDTTWDRQRLIAQKIMRTRLFFISYTPLWAIFAIRSHATVSQVVFWLLTGWGFLDDLRGWFSYGVYFLVAWAVFVPSDLGLVNPTLYILGWRLVEGTRRGRSELIICQDPPGVGSEEEPVAKVMGGAGWIRRPTRRPWTWVSRR